ncbi:MAG: putative DNA binding domain-containing protein [Actinomycetota bacterium]|nr:putative DNA binding domain-containing protein [Actinomycetota bacterium]
MPLTRAELREMLLNGEGSGVEFKRDEVHNHDLAKEIVALSNLRGGHVILGVDDDGAVVGTTRPDLEEWVAQLCRDKMQPALIPYFSWFRELEAGRDVAVVQVLPGPDKPYAQVHGGRRTFLIRVGSINREATTQELQPMFQEAGRLAYGTKPIPGGWFGDLDLRRLRSYLEGVLSVGAPSGDDAADWAALLMNLELMVEFDGVATPTVDGLILFGRTPERFLPQTGVRAITYRGPSPDYATQADEVLRGPLAPLLAANGEIVEASLIDQALSFVTRNTTATASLAGGRRVDRPAYPAEVVREVMVNALVHRDYSIAGTDVALTIYDDALEVRSPGRLPNTATVESLRAGFRYARNQTLVNVMRDFGYVEFRGMGIRSKVIPGMLAHNGTEPEFVESEHAFTVRLLATGSGGDRDVDQAAPS